MIPDALVEGISLTDCQYNFASLLEGFKDPDAWDVVMVIRKDYTEKKALAFTELYDVLMERYGLSLEDAAKSKFSSLDELREYNVILLGMPCTNFLVDAYLDNPDNCETVFEPGQGILAARQWPNGKKLVLVSGENPEGVYLAAEIMRRALEDELSLEGYAFSVFHTDGEPYEVERIDSCELTLL